MKLQIRSQFSKLTGPYFSEWFFFPERKVQVLQLATAGICSWTALCSVWMQFLSVAAMTETEETALSIPSISKLWIRPLYFQHFDNPEPSTFSLKQKQSLAESPLMRAEEALVVQLAGRLHLVQDVEADAFKGQNAISCKVGIVEHDYPPGLAHRHQSKDHKMNIKMEENARGNFFGIKRLFCRVQVNPHKTPSSKLYSIFLFHLHGWLQVIRSTIAERNLL